MSLLKKLSLVFTVLLAMIISTCGYTAQTVVSMPEQQLATLEKLFGGKIGVYAIDTNTQQVIAYRANESFPVQSTMKLVAVSALLKQSEQQDALLQKNILYTKNDLKVEWHPVTGKHLTQGMTLEALAEAAMTYSDNTAANLIIKLLGGPKAVTAFARSVDNKSFNVEHYEGHLNSNPKHIEDSSTPKDMAISLQKLTLGNVLTPSKRTLLVTWMRNNTTGYKRMRAGIPIGWVIADKTGSGDYGVVNDIGIIWSPWCKPIVLAIYTVQSNPNARGRPDIVAAATKIVLDAFLKQNHCSPN